MSRQKKTSEKKRRREAYAAKKSASTSKVSVPSTSMAASQVQEKRTTSAQRVANSCFKKVLLRSLPAGPSVRAEVLAAGIQALSPTSKRAVNNRLGICSPNSKKKLDFDQNISASFREQLGKLSLRRNHKDLRLKRSLAMAVTLRNKAAAQYFGISKKMKLKVLHESNKAGWEDHRKPRKDTVPEETAKEIVTFFNDGDISRDLPDARSASIQNGKVQSRKVLQSSLLTTYEKYAEMYGPKVSFSVSKRHRPQTVLPFTSHKYRECLCEYCANVDLKLKSLNAAIQQDLRIQDRFQVSRLTLCPKELDANYKKNCLDRQCTSCGTQELSRHLDTVLTTSRSTPTGWFQWEQAQVGHGKTRLMKIKHESTFEGLVEALAEDLTPFSAHLFNAKWQSAQYKSITSKCPSNTVVFCEDFAENYTCRPQDAPQGCHWNNTQCTIHPVVASYNCTVEDCSEVITDSIIFISEDLTHDHHAVHHFVSSSVLLLKEEGVDFNRLVQFSDGAPTQYKNRIAFVDCSYAMGDMGITAEHHFFGSRHGKGPCDREIGVIKKSVARAVAARQDEVASPHDLFVMCQKRLCLPRMEEHYHTKRRFIFVEKTSITRERPDRTSTKALKNTRKLHCVKGVEPYVLTVRLRERSCFCTGCRADDPCLHADIPGPWSVCSLSVAIPRNARRQGPPPPPMDDQASPPPPVDDQAPPPSPMDDQPPPPSPADQAPLHPPVDDQAPPPMDNQALPPPPADDQDPPPPPADNQDPPPPPVDDQASPPSPAVNNQAQPVDGDHSSQSTNMYVFTLSLTLISCTL